MALSGVLDDHPGELRSDFQRFFGLNIDEIEISFSAWHAAELAAHMPQGSLLYAAVDPSAAWGASEYLLHAIEYDLRTFAWSMAGGRKAGAKPSPLPTPKDAARKAKALNFDKREAEEIADLLGIPKDRR